VSSVITPEGRSLLSGFVGAIASYEQNLADKHAADKSQAVADAVAAATAPPADPPAEVPPAS